MSLEADVVDGFAAPPSVPEYVPRKGTGKHTFFEVDQETEGLLRSLPALGHPDDDLQKIICCFVSFTSQTQKLLPV